MDAAVEPRRRRRTRRSSTTCYRDDDGGQRVRARRQHASRSTPPQLEGAEHVATITGAELGGATYEPIFDFFAGTDNAHQVLVADWVADDEGTGIVHIAPGFGEDDKAVADAAGIPTITPVDEKASFTAEVPPYAGMQVFDANKDIIRDLKARGVIVRHDSYLHSYPHCWRTDTPLIYKAMSSWFVAVTEIKDRMIELNQQITLGARPRQGRQLRQVARGSARLVDQPQPLLGLADPGVEVRRSRLSAHRRVRLDRRARSRLRRRGHRPAPPDDRRARPAQPRRPDRASR